jgi:uracil-DNA glycosylase family 4
MTITYVGPEGSNASNIAFIGEAPGEHEVRLGRPFMGNAGQLLNGLLQTVGIDRSKCYITNVVKERPPKNDISKFITFNSRGEAQPTFEYSHYEEQLLEELRQCSANVLVPLGNTALYALTRQRGITKYRGSILESPVLGGRKVIPTIHPSEALRDFTTRYLIAFDLRRVVREANFPDVRRPSTPMLIAPTFDAVLEYLQIAKHADVVAFDIEVSRLQLDCFSLCYPGGAAISVPFIKCGQPYFSLTQQAVILRKLQDILEGPSRIVMQNGMYDSTFMYERYGIIITNPEDTMIAMGLLYPDLPKGLNTICSIYTDYPYYKDDGKQRFKGFLTNDDIFWKYSATDAAATLDAYDKLMTDVRNFGIEDTYRSHLALYHPLLFMQKRGIPMNVTAMHEYKTKVAEQLALLQQQLNEIAGRELNTNSSKQLINYFYTELQHDPYLKRGTGGSRPSVDVNALRRLSRKGVKEATIIMQMRKLSKLKSTYLEVTLDEDNVLRCGYNPIGTTTGRLASRETIFDTGTNKQNQPRIMKKFMLVRDGFAVYPIDLKGAENRLVAYMGPVPPMVRAFEEGIDVHSLTASLLYNIPLDQVSRAKGSAGIPNSDKSQRDIGKMVNHSGNYGVGYKKLALQADMQERYVKPILERYHELYPEVRSKYQAQVRQQLDRYHYVINPFGRKRKFYTRPGEETYNAAYSFLAQSTVADVVNRWGLAFIYDNPDFPYVYLIDQIHDSITLEIPLSNPWTDHARAILAVTDSMAQPITWRGRTFSLPSEVQLARHTLANTAEIPLDVPLGAHPRDRVEYVACVLQRTWHSLQ